MIVIKIAKQLNMFTPTEVSVYRFVKLTKKIYDLLLQYAKENNIPIQYSNESTLPSENEIVIIEPLLLIHKFSLCPAVQFLQQFYYSQLHSKYNFPII